MEKNVGSFYQGQSLMKNSLFKIGDIVLLKRVPDHKGIIKSVIEKEREKYFYKVFWFVGEGSEKLFAQSELAKEKRQ
jgi:hypothetical protein